MPTRMIARLVTAAALAALALSPLGAAAQTDADAQPPADSALWPLLFDAIDADGDGAIAPDELAAALAQLPPRSRGALLQALVDPEARRAAMAADMVARLDTDGDGAISPEEMAAGMAARAATREDRRAARMEGRMMESRTMERGAPRWHEGRRAERMDRAGDHRSGWQGERMRNAPPARD